MMVRRIVAPPTVPWFPGFPRARVAAEHVAPHHGRPDVGKRFLDDHGALVNLAAFESVFLAPHPERKRPFVQSHASNPERIVDALTGAGDEPIERHRDLEAQLGHVLPEAT